MVKLLGFPSEDLTSCHVQNFINIFWLVGTKTTELGLGKDDNLG